MYVTAFNGPRDSLQLPLSLQEAGLLQRHVCDFYPQAWLPVLRSRGTPELPAERVQTVASAAARNLCLKMRKGPLRNSRSLWKIDRAIGNRARDVALAEGGQIFTYSRYAYPAFTAPGLQERRKGLFLFHPFEPFVRGLFQQDTARYPYLEESMRHELEFLDAWRDEELEAEWRLADFIVCASELSRRSLINHGCPTGKIHVVPYGVDAARVDFDPARKSRSGPLKVLFLGQGVQRKGLHHLLEAWQGIGSREAELKAVCYRLDPQIAALAPEAVQFHPKLPREELHALLASAHVLVLPSIAEGFGLVLLEALAHGCLLVATDRTGLPDLELPVHLRHIIPAGDVDSLRQAINNLAALHASAGLDHEGARQAALEHTWKRFRERVATIAQEAL